MRRLARGLLHGQADPPLQHGAAAQHLGLGVAGPAGADRIERALDLFGLLLDAQARGDTDVGGLVHVLLQLAAGAAAIADSRTVSLAF